MILERDFGDRWIDDDGDDDVHSQLVTIKAFFKTFSIEHFRFTKKLREPLHN